MQIHNLIQGTNEWHLFRAEHFGASEAAAMLGLSKKVKRTELLHMKHTGTAKEFTDWVQANILDYGHEVEAMARPLVEEIIADELYPVTCSEGIYSASCDGLTMTEDVAFEHKQWNEALAQSVADGILPEEHMPQCQQVLMVSGASKVVFVVSNGTPDKLVHMDVLPDAEWFDRIKAGWSQFEKDLAGYSPRELAEKPQAEAIMQLPALMVQIRGEVATSNLPAFKAAAEQFIANIKTDLQTDQDFADAESTVKFCDKAEKDLELTKSAAIAQTASIDELMRTIDFIKEQLRSKRLMLEKLVTTKKTAIKEKILADAKLAFGEHVADLEAEIKPIRLVYAQPDFAGAAKNKRTLASLHDAVDTELANAKIATNATAADVRAKLAWCKTNAEGYGFLFMDMQQIISKQSDDFQLLVTSRIADHKRIEAEKAEAIIKRIQAEEEAKAAAKVKAEQQAEAQAEREKAEDLRKWEENKRRLEEQAQAEAARITKAEQDRLAAEYAQKIAEAQAAMDARQRDLDHAEGLMLNAQFDQLAAARALEAETAAVAETVAAAVVDSPQDAIAKFHQLCDVIERDQANRPTDDQIAWTVAEAFSVDIETATDWLLAFGSTEF